MTTHYELHGVSFEWDNDKATTNRHKHLVDFEAACEVFLDPFLRPADAGEESDELRQAVLGLTTTWALLLVVYVERGDTLRIISARPVTSAERNRYEDL